MAICGIVYLIICGVVVWLWDFVYHVNLPFFSNLIVGFLTIIGAFLLGYWIYERGRTRREKETLRREIEKKQRVLRSLRMFKNWLLPWVFNLACVLSGRFVNYDDTLIYSGKYRDDIPNLDDIFGIGTHDSQGKRLRGTEQASNVNLEVIQRPQTPQTLYGTLRYGLQSLEPIEKQIIEFPSLIEEVEPKVAKIVHLSNDLRLRIKELEDWEKKHEGKVFDKIGTDTIGNIRRVGGKSLNIVLEIEANIDKLSSETRN